VIPYLPTIIIFVLKGKKLANIKSNEKRNRQNEKRRQKNSQIKSTIRTGSKKINAILQSKEEMKSQELTDMYKNFVKNIDTAAGNGAIHKRTAARKKSRIAKKINAQRAGQAQV